MILKDEMEMEQQAPQPGMQGQEQMVDGGNQGQATIQPNEQAQMANENAMIDQGQGQVGLGPGQQAQLDAYTDNATIAVYSEKSQPAILQLLQGTENKIENIANAAYTVHKQLESSLVSSGEKMSEVTMAIGASHLVAELVTLAEAAKLYTLTDEEKALAYQHSVRKYFESGLADGSIDPVELQKTLEPLMNEEQRQYGLQAMEQHGISKTAPPAGYGRKRKGGGAMAQQPQQQQQQGILGRA